MPAYDICYLEEDGTLACAFSVLFESEMRAKILAHAMKPAECHRLEVWHGRELIYRRPDSFEARRAAAPCDALDARRPLAQTRRHGPSDIASPA